MAGEDAQPLQPQQAPPTQPQQAPPQNAVFAVGSNLKNAALNVLKEVGHVSKSVREFARKDCLSDLIVPILLQRKPWGEMVDRSSFTRPANLAEVGPTVYNMHGIFNSTKCSVDK